MAKSKNSSGNQGSGSMLNQKTNEDFNRKTPDPDYVRRQKSGPKYTVPDIAADSDEIKKRDGVEQNKGENKSEGSA